MSWSLTIGKVFGTVIRIHRTTLEQTFKLLQQKRAAAVGVIDCDGKLIGLVTGETIAEMTMLQDLLPKGVNIGPWMRPPPSKTA